MITVKEVMSTEVLTLKTSDSVSTARNLMKDKHIRHIPVVDENYFPVGIITQRDILRVQCPDLKNNEQLTDEQTIFLEQIMSREISYTRPGDPLRSAGIKLQKKKYGCLPVMDNNKLVGIITDSDFVDVALNLIEQVEISEDYE
ncbi:MAG: CBS domain-containing protein [gamma proteobacterium symbiont of Taylorina sp.]|nr:CBS domain-containing protein [gamma proteobacterium symbiont of Taylorina sp.]